MLRLVRKSVILFLVTAAVFIAASPAFAETEPFKDYLIRNLKNKVEEIDLSEYGFKTDEMSKISNVYNEFVNENPEYLCDFHYTYREKDQVLLAMKINSYTLSDDEINAFHSKVDEILSHVEDGWTDFQKLLYVHDYVVTHLIYDPDYYYKSNAYDAIMGGGAICDGYAKSFLYLTRKLDIPCLYISSPALDHAWNAVELDGSWYYVDCTWDDGWAGDEWAESAEHDCFLMTTKETYEGRGYSGESHDTKDWVKSDGSDAYNGIVTGESITKGDYKFITESDIAVRQVGSRIYYGKEDYKDYGDQRARSAVWSYDLSTKKKTKEFSYTSSNIYSHYTGKTAVIPNLRIYMNSGKMLSTDKYKIDFRGIDPVNVGMYFFTLRVDGYEFIPLTIFFDIQPPKTAITKVVRKKKGFVVKWKKKANDQVTGYKIRYSRHSDMSGGKTIKITDKNKTSYTIKKLKSKKKYYVTVYTYKMLDGNTYESDYCKKKKVVTK